MPDATELNELKKELKRNEHEGAEVALELRASRERIGILEAELVDLRASGGGTDHEARSAPNGSVAQCVLGPHDCSVPQGCEAACEVAEAQEHLSLAGSLFHGTACGTGFEARSAPHGSVAQCVSGHLGAEHPKSGAACESAEAEEHVYFAGSIGHCMLPEKFEVGAMVILEGLLNASYNQQRATILTRKLLNGCQEVRLESSQVAIAFKVGNLRLLSPPGQTDVRNEEADPLTTASEPVTSGALFGSTEPGETLWDGWRLEEKLSGPRSAGNFEQMASDPLSSVALAGGVRSPQNTRRILEKGAQVNAVASSASDAGPTQGGLSRGFLLSQLHDLQHREFAWWCRVVKRPDDVCIEVCIEE